MRYIILCILFILLGCKKENVEKMHYPNGKLNYILNKNEDTVKITFFDKSEKPSMYLSFYKDHFVGTISYAKNSIFPFKDSITIDSVRGPYFYGTEYIILKKNTKIMGAFRYKRNSDFRKALSSRQPFGVHNTYDMNGNIIGKDDYMIVNDTLYNTKIEL